MAYALAREFPGVGDDLYARIVAEFGPTPPKGLIVHASALVDGAVRLIEVWESKALRDHFVQERLDPVRRAATGQHHAAPPPGASQFEITVEHLVRP